MAPDCPMPNRSHSRWMLLLAAITAHGLAGCSKPQPAAPTQDFARRHDCPVGSVEADKEASNRMRVTGCGESEIYVRTCGSRGASFPESDARQPMTEAEGRHSSPRRPAFDGSGCAWSRQQNLSTTRAGGPTQPKWLSEP